jgi:hypothetical protein
MGIRKIRLTPQSDMVWFKKVLGGHIPRSASPETHLRDFVIRERWSNGGESARRHLISG